MYVDDPFLRPPTKIVSIQARLHTKTEPRLKPAIDPLSLLYPAGKTVLMQHLQTLVLRGNSLWIGGLIPPEKLEGLVAKLAARYPVTRDERGRTYDRSRGIATAHLVVFPTAGQIAWWVLTSEGKSGLADPASLDSKVAKHAMACDGHIEFEDYVLLYAHKRDARTVKNARTGKSNKVLKDCSTWTWKLRPTVLAELRTKLAAEIKSLNYGQDECERPYGVRGFLDYQRRRPLFSGVRSQVLALHRDAIDQWSDVRKTWLGRHPRFVQKYGANAGLLRPLSEITTRYLPKMSRLSVFTDMRRTVRSLIVGCDLAADAKLYKALQSSTKG